MTIQIVFKNVGYSISFGDSAQSECMYWFSVTKEYYANKQVVYGKWICGWFKHKRFRKSY